MLILRGLRLIGELKKLLSEPGANKSLVMPDVMTGSVSGFALDEVLRV
jgi:hypothetical protein